MESNDGADARADSFPNQSANYEPFFPPHHAADRSAICPSDADADQHTDMYTNVGPDGASHIDAINGPDCRAHCGTVAGPGAGSIAPPDSRSVPDSLPSANELANNRTLRIANLYADLRANICGAIAAPVSRADRHALSRTVGDADATPD